MRGRGGLTATDPLERPIFVVAPPRAGVRLAAAVLPRAGCWSLGAAQALLTTLPELDPPDGSREGRLEAGDCTPAVRRRLRGQLQVEFARRRRPGAGRLLHAHPRNALLVPFLVAAFPGSSFVYVHRDPADALAEALLVWRDGSAVTYPKLTGWTGPPWSFLLVPGWRELSGRPLAEVVTEQWVRTMRALAGDLERLAPDRWCVVSRDALRRNPDGERARLARYLGLDASAPLSQAPVEAAFPSPDLLAARAELEPYLDRTRALADRAASWLAG